MVFEKKYAFLFNSDTTETYYNDYYDEDGLSLKRAFKTIIIFNLIALIPLMCSDLKMPVNINSYHLHPATGEIKDKDKTVIALEEDLGDEGDREDVFEWDGSNWVESETSTFLNVILNGEPIFENYSFPKSTFLI